MASATPSPSPSTFDGVRPGLWIHAAGTVPETHSYPGIDQLLASFRDLAAAHPALVTERRIGTSRLGEPLYCFTVSDTVPADAASPSYVVVGGVHPNEPVGAVTTLHLATTLCEDAVLRSHFGGAWHIVPCIDPDGARLNEGWFATPTDKRRYGRHFYRPASREQVEWTFPFAYKDAYFDRVLPETHALMRLLDDTRPLFLTTLHNCETGGVYYYLSRPAPALHGLLHAIPASQGIPLSTGEPEAAHAPRYAPAIFGCIDMRDTYDHLERLGADPASELAGGSSAAYVERHGTFYFVTEVPHWTHPHSDNDTPVAESYRDVVVRRAEGMAQTSSLLSGLLDAVSPHLALETPFLRAIRDFVPSLAQLAAVETARAHSTEDRPATVAERYACDATLHSCRIRYGGMLLRLLDAELTAGTATPEVRTRHRELSQIYEKWEDEAEPVSGSPIPIATLAGIQYAALLAAADHARDEAAEQAPSAAPGPRARADTVPESAPEVT